MAVVTMIVIIVDIVDKRRKWNDNGKKGKKIPNDGSKRNWKSSSGGMNVKMICQNYEKMVTHNKRVLFRKKYTLICSHYIYFFSIHYSCCYVTLYHCVVVLIFFRK